MVSLQAEDVKWGTLSFRGTRVLPGEVQQELQRIGAGNALDRLSREGVVSFRLEDFSAGLLTSPGIYNANSLINNRPVAAMYRYNQGLVTRYPGFLGLPYVVTNQSSITSDEDISGLVAANKRRHDLLSAVGSSAGPVHYCAIGTKLYRASTTTGAWSVADPFTDTGTAIAELNVNGTIVLAVATNGTTDDIKYTADPTAAPPSWTSLIALSAGDYITAMRYFPTLGPGVNVIVGKVGGTNGVWYMDTETAAPWTLKPLVLTATKNDANPNGSAITVTSSNETVATNSSPGNNETWTNPSDGLTSDDTRATNSITSGLRSDYLGLINLNLGTYPTGTIPTLFRFTFEGSESATDDNIMREDCQIGIWTTPSLTGAPDIVFTGTQAGVSGEFTTGDASYNFDAPSAIFGQLTGAHLSSQALMVAINFIDTAGTSPQLRIDDMSVTLSAILPGQSVAFPVGGFQINRDPTNPNSLTIITPKADEAATITAQPREAWTLAFEWDSTGNRPTFSFSQRNEGLTNTWHACPGLGGTLITGGREEGPGTEVYFIDSAGELVDYKFPSGEYGAYASVKCNSVYVHGAWGVLDIVMYSSGTTVANRQTWFLDLNSGAYYADTALQSVTSLGITAAPIAPATFELNAPLGLLYSLFPNSTDTAVARQFIPTDLAADPRVVHTTEVKQMAWSGGTESAGLYLEGVRLAVGPEGLYRNINVIDFQGVEVDDNTAYGGVTVAFSTDGGSTFGISNAFTATGVYNVPSSGSAYTSLLARITLTHTA